MTQIASLRQLSDGRFAEGGLPKNNGFWNEKVYK